MSNTDVVYEDVVKMLGLLVERIRSNDPMPARSKENIEEMFDQIKDWNSPHQKKVMDFAKKIGGEESLFELLHPIRRWYTGQTMARLILSYRDDLMDVMDLEPDDVVGCFRGFHVSDDDPLADVEEGDEITIPVKRNHKFSSWSLNKELVNRFSGKSKGKVGLVVKLLDTDNIKPVLAPPAKTCAWFNALYELVIGKSFRPTEDEYLIYGRAVNVKIIKVKNNQYFLGVHVGGAELPFIYRHSSSDICAVSFGAFNCFSPLESVMDNQVKCVETAHTVASEGDVHVAIIAHQYACRSAGIKPARAEQPVHFKIVSLVSGTMTLRTTTGDETI